MPWMSKLLATSAAPRRVVWALLFAAAAGCVPKSELLTAKDPVPVSVALVVEPAEGRAPLDPPEAVAAAVDAVLSARKLTPTRVNAASWAEVFTNKRTSAQRLGWLVEQPGQTLVMLVETHASYYSEMNGRYRWTVSTNATLVPRDRPAEAVTSSFEIPVFLNFYHQKEDAALEAAVPVLSRRLGELVDAWLSAQSSG